MQKNWMNVIKIKKKKNVWMRVIHFMLKLRKKKKYILSVVYRPPK